MSEWRHELKYEINTGEYLGLRAHLGVIMKRDSHAGPSGIYEISSLYFDNYRDRALAEKISGVSEREKFRIRKYNGNTAFMRLEKKMKNNGLCRKVSCEIKRETVQDILAGRFRLPQDCPALLVEFYAKYKAQSLVPKTVVTYKREPFVYKAGNVRVTFDTDIRTGMYSTAFLDDEYTAPATHPGLIVLEVKFDEYLPDVVRDYIQLGRPRVQSFSKYAACRSFE